MRSMDDLHRLEAKGLARAKIRSKRRRVQEIRRRTIRGSLALFAVVWGIVFGQLVTGNDPALSRIHSKLLASTHHVSKVVGVEEAVPSEVATPNEESAHPEEPSRAAEAEASQVPAPVQAPIITSAS